MGIRLFFFTFIQVFIQNQLSKMIQPLWNKQIQAYAAGFLSSLVGFFPTGFSAAGFLVSAAFLPPKVSSASEHQ